MVIIGKVAVSTFSMDFFSVDVNVYITKAHSFRMQFCSLGMLSRVKMEKCNNLFFMNQFKTFNNLPSYLIIWQLSI